MRKVKVEDFGNAVFDLLSEYADDVSDEVKSSVQKIGEETAKEVSENASAQFNGTKYKNSIRCKVKKGRLYSEATVYSPNHYQLTHLLENGHHLVYFGHRTNTFIPGRKHWLPAEQHAIQKLERKVIKAVKQ